MHLIPVSQMMEKLKSPIPNTKLFFLHFLSSSHKPTFPLFALHGWWVNYYGVQRYHVSYFELTSTTFNVTVVWRVWFRWIWCYVLATL